MPNRYTDLDLLYEEAIARKPTGAPEGAVWFGNVYNYASSRYPLKSILGNQRKQFQRSPLQTFFSPFPLSLITQ
jgi:hypothetical protein